MKTLPRKMISAIATAVALAQPVSATDIVVGLGTLDFEDDGAVLDLEYHAEPSTRFRGADVSFTAVVSADTKSDIFIGAGISAIRQIGDSPWFVEGSFAPGLFFEGSEETDLGQTLEFRTLIGIGRRFDNDYSLSLAASHLSNGGLGDFNPGVNAITLRLRRSF
ncbi:MAG: acyloxyacyl hydrolase [Pseudomonadota bacterium]